MRRIRTAWSARQIEQGASVTLDVSRCAGLAIAPESTVRGVWIRCGEYSGPLIEGDPIPTFGGQGAVTVEVLDPTVGSVVLAVAERCEEVPFLPRYVADSVETVYEYNTADGPIQIDPTYLRLPRAGVSHVLAVRLLSASWPLPSPQVREAVLFDGKLSEIGANPEDINETYPATWLRIHANGAIQFVGINTGGVGTHRFRVSIRPGLA